MAKAEDTLVIDPGADLGELEGHLLALQGLVDGKREDRRQELREQVKNLTEAIGETPESLFGWNTSDGKKRGSRSKGGPKREPKYRDSETGNTWAGLGAKPKWLHAKIDAGAKLEDFLIAGSN